MPTTIKVTEIDHGWADIRKRVYRLGDTGAICRVGVQGPPAAANHQNARISVAQIAQVHEFGKRIWQPKRKRWVIIPERSFLRKTVDVFADAIAKREAAFAYGVLIGKFDLRTALEAFGGYVVGLMQQRIADRIPPKNAPYTIAKKGSDVPLIDKGQLRGSITYIIEGA
jgi:hypothetical protein